MFNVYTVLFSPIVQLAAVQAVASAGSLFIVQRTAWSPFALDKVRSLCLQSRGHRQPSKRLSNDELFCLRPHYKAILVICRAHFCLWFCVRPIYIVIIGIALARNQISLILYKTLFHFKSKKTPTTMQVIAFSSLLLAAASAFPLEYSNIGPRDCTLGQFVCQGTQQWALCGPSGLQFQSVAAGTECVNGAIVAAGAAPAPAPVPAPAPAPAAPAPAPPSSGPVSSSYKMYTGDGSSWPAFSTWPSFDAIWAANKATLSASCTQFLTPNNSDEENASIQSAILGAASSTGVDARFILAIIMQESKGCVRVWTTSYSVANPGIMQTHAGTGTCNTGISSGGPPAAAGTISNPCPKDQIELMVQEGTAGTSSGDGLKQLGAVGTDAKAYYAAARKYNSGSVAADGDLSSVASVATKCYASDIANRVMGWVGATGCKLDGA